MSSPSTPTLVISVLTNLAGDADAADLLSGGHGAAELSPGEQAVQREMYFKVKTTTKMQKLFKAFLEHRGIPLVQRDALCFLTPTNHVISGHDSPNALDLSDGDQLRCVFDRKNLP